MNCRMREEDIKVASNLLRIRKEKGLSQGAIAKLLGVSWQVAQYYESGRNRIAAGKIGILARELNIPVDDFFK